MRISGLIGFLFVLLCMPTVRPHPVWGQLEQLRKPAPSSAAPAGPPTQRAASMVAIPEGEFVMGAEGTDTLADERPLHRVWLDRFEIDRYEVSTAQYAAFLTTTDRKVPWQWNSEQRRQHPDRPVIGVSRHDAEAYCRSRAARLPTEAEWEKAARGADGRRFPWGHRLPTEALANFGLGARFSYGQALAPVQAYAEGVSPYGLHQMAGNVWEWTADWYGAEYYEVSPTRNPVGPERGQFRVVRGGSWSDLPKYLLTYGRFKLPPDTQNSYTGFRCARSVDPVASP